MSLQVGFDYLNNNPLLRVAGSSDLAALDKLKLATNLHFRAGCPIYYLELSGIEYVDSVLLSFLLNIHLQYQAMNTSLVFLNTSQILINVLVATGLDTVLVLDEMDLPPNEVYAGKFFS